MSFEKRLDKLTERHEALTQTVELMAADHRQTAAENAAENKERDRRLAQLMEGLASLVHVAEIHAQ